MWAHECDDADYANRYGTEQQLAQVGDWLRGRTEHPQCLWTSETANENCNVLGGAQVT